MSLVSLECLRFALVLLLAYFLVPARWRWLVILVGNVVFYCSHGTVYIIFPLSIALVAYFSAFFFERQRKNTDRNGGDEDKRKQLKAKKQFMTLSVIIILAPWIVLKYGDFLAENIMALLGLHEHFGRSGWILPLGMSYYTFHAIGYLTDIYRKKYPAERNFLKFFTFLSFFSHMIQGPFSRYDELGKSLFSEQRFSFDRLREGSARILWGVFKKIVIADELAATVDMIIGDYSSYSGVQIFFAVFLYSIRLYADFSGYMDMVCGYSNIMGIQVAENFRQPFFARSVDEYWRRWHITLGRWFRDYVFYPASMSKYGMKLSKWARKKWGAKTGKLVSGYFALVFVWTATGLWHGANWTYLIWGYLNLFAIASSMQLSDCYNRIKTALHINSDGICWKIFCVIRTFILISLFRVFSLSPTAGSAFSLFWHAVSEFGISTLRDPSVFFIAMYREEILIVLPAIAAMFAVDIIQERGKWDKLKAALPVVLRAFIFAVMIVACMLMIKGSDLTGGFMYANY